MSNTPSIVLCEPADSVSLKDKHDSRPPSRSRGLSISISEPLNSPYPSKAPRPHKPPRRTSKSSDKLFEPSPNVSTETFLHPRSAANSREDLLRFLSNPDSYTYAEDVPEHVPDAKDQRLAKIVTGGLSLFTVLVLILGIVIPLKCIVPLPVNVLVPFYVDPGVGAWDRLHEAILHPRTSALNFTIVINPDNGPGNSTLPSKEYIDAIKRLNVYPNVQTLGYVNIGYGLRSNMTIRNAIKTYAGWGNITGLGLDGIYFDHTPSQFTNRTSAYMKSLGEMIKQSPGFRSQRLVVHNPGTVPNITFVDDVMPDVTVVFEGAYSDLPSRRGISNVLGPMRGNRENYAFLVHSVAENIGRGGLRRIVNEVRRDVEWLFVTDLNDKVYDGFGSVWEDFLDLTW